MMQKRRIVFISFDTDFFVRHFHRVVHAARMSGFAIFAVLPTAPTATADFPQDVDIIAIDAGRSRHPILRLPSHVIAISSALRTCKPDIVQVFSLHACVVLALSSMFVPFVRKIYTITGLGLIDIDKRWSNQIMRPFVYWLLRFAERGASTYFVFENSADPVRIGFSSGRLKRKMTLMGAGVDPAAFAPQPQLSVPPLKLAIVSRLIWSKGIDLAVKAVARLIDQGVPVELDIYGSLDSENQRSISVNQLEEWTRCPGVRWHGFTNDVVRVWRTHHVALFPSRGGEGLPRALLEAASCGRAAIAADVAGCADFVRPDVEGIIVKPNSVEDLERAINRLVQDPDLLVQMGNAARQRVLENSTDEIIDCRYRRLFTEMLEAT